MWVGIRNKNNVIVEIGNKYGRNGVSGWGEHDEKRMQTTLGMQTKREHYVYIDFDLG